MRLYHGNSQNVFFFLYSDNREVLITSGENGVLCVYSIDNDSKAEKRLKVIITYDINRFFSIEFIYLIIQKFKTLDSKCSSIQSICLAEVTRFGSNDIIVADSKGQIVLFFKEQIVCRKKVSDYPITSLSVYNKPSNKIFLKLKAEKI